MELSLILMAIKTIVFSDNCRFLFALREILNISDTNVFRDIRRAELFRLNKGHGGRLNASDETMNSKNRREAPRFNSPARLKFELLAGESASESRYAALRDYSVRGFYFFSPVPYAPGTLLHFSATAGEIEPVDLLSGIARVIRCDQLDHSNAEAFGIATTVEDVRPD